jgi:hypothetical protein
VPSAATAPGRRVAIRPSESNKLSRRKLRTPTTFRMRNSPERRQELGGETIAELEEAAALSVESVEQGAEVVDGTAGAARPEAVPPLIIELETGGVVVVEGAADLAGAVGLAAGEGRDVGGGRDREQLPVEIAARRAAGM